jgi:hypothetical protein
VFRRLASLPVFERARPLLVLGGVVVVGLIWVVAFKASSTNTAWDSEWSAPSDTRGKSVGVWNRDVETQAERDKRLATSREAADLKDDLRDVKKSLLGNASKTRGNAVTMEKPELPRDLEFNAREACMQMKLEFPERYANVDCMSERYDSADPWWER